jgi:hypothetical protein
VQQNISCKGGRGIYLTQSLKETYKNRSGNVADINLLLVKLLKSKGLDASPVLISTRDHGFASEIYPVVNKFNYVICKVTIDNKNYFLDASQRCMAFGKVPSSCYNGVGRTICNNPTPEYFIPDEVFEKKVTNVVLALDNKNKTQWTGSVYTVYGDQESGINRKTILDQGQKIFDEKITGSFTDDLKADQVEVINMAEYDEPLEVKYALNIDNKNSKLIYFNPMLKEKIDEIFLNHM